ncbi:hypothetical protein VB005_09771 [Metarhizium brunneum]
MRWELFKVATLAALVQSVSAAPSTDKEVKLKIVKTTTEDGITVDWLTRESQGEKFTPPSEPLAGADRGIWTKTSSSSSSPGLRGNHPNCTSW